MLNLNEFLSTPMGEGVKQLSERLAEEDMPPVTLNCIGGFALMMHNMRDLKSSTDIDYVGKHLGEKFDKIVNEVGDRLHLGKGWVNNDGMLTGASIEDFELSTGKLHFDHAMDVGNIRINVLQQPDLLRMKIISIDTSLMSAQDHVTNLDRSRDMSDIKNLMDAQGLNLDDVDDIYGEYIQSDKTIPAIEAYGEGGLEAVYALLDKAETQPDKLPDGLDADAERATDLGKALSSGGFSIGSILDMAKAKASRPMPSSPAQSEPAASGQDAPKAPWE